jgi:hypothetical protein
VDAADFDDLSSGLVDSYLLYLRGRGPEPDLAGLTADQRRRLTDQLAIVAALADRAPVLPPLESDPVAIRLGLVAPAEISAGFPVESDAESDDPVHAALRQLELRFDGQVAVDHSPAWKEWQSAELSAVAQCSALGSSVALFTTPRGPLAGEPSGVAVFLRQYPDISAVCLSSPDGRDAALLTAADATASVDPVRGWLEPGVHTAVDSLDVTLGRYFESRLPRWERVAALTELIDLGDVSADAVAVATASLAAARRSRPRLQHRRAAVTAVKALDPSSIAAVVADVQAGRLGGTALVSRLSALAGAVAS